VPPGCIIEHRATACPECAPAARGTTGTVFPSCTAGSSGLLAATDGPAPLQLVEPGENQILSGRLTLELSVTAPRERRPHHDSGEGFRRASSRAVARDRARGAADVDRCLRTVTDSHRVAVNTAVTVCRGLLSAQAPRSAMQLAQPR
jgi:hypothetical protein